MSKRFFILCSRPYHWWKKAKRGSFLYSVHIPTVCGTRANLRLRVCQANKLECPPHTFCSSSSQRHNFENTIESHLPFTFKDSSPQWSIFSWNPVFNGINKRRKKRSYNSGNDIFITYTGWGDWQRCCFQIPLCWLHGRNTSLKKKYQR